MIVWVLEIDNIDGSSIIAEVFSTEDLARKYITDNPINGAQYCLWDCEVITE